MSKSYGASAAVRRLLLLCVVGAMLQVGRGWRVPPPTTSLGRRAAVGGGIAAALLPSTRAAHADSKYSKEFETCLSKCVYEQTKITKGIGKVEVMSRTEAYGMCKPKVKRRRAQERCFPCADPAPPLVLAQCATSKEQLLIGQPKKS